MTIQKRIVYDIFMLFGDIGGLGDFLVLGLASVFGLFSEHLKTADLITQMFRVSNGNKPGVQVTTPIRALK